MNKKLDNLKEAEYLANYNLVGEVIVRIKKKFPNNRKISECTIAMAQIAGYVNNLIADRFFYEKTISEYRADKLRAIERARKSEEKVKLLEEKLKSYE